MFDLLHFSPTHIPLDSAWALALHLASPALYAVLAALEAHEGLRARLEKRPCLHHFIAAGVHALLAALDAL